MYDETRIDQTLTLKLDREPHCLYASIHHYQEGWEADINVNGEYAVIAHIRRRDPVRPALSLPFASRAEAEAWVYVAFAAYVAADDPTLMPDYRAVEPERIAHCAEAFIKRKQVLAAAGLS